MSADGDVEGSKPRLPVFVAPAFGATEREKRERLHMRPPARFVKRPQCSLTTRRRGSCGVQRLWLCTHDQEPQHEHHLSQEGGEGKAPVTARSRYRNPAVLAFLLVEFVGSRGGLAHPVKSSLHLGLPRPCPSRLSALPGRAGTFGATGRESLPLPLPSVPRKDTPSRHRPSPAHGGRHTLVPLCGMENARERSSRVLGALGRLVKNSARDWRRVRRGGQAAEGGCTELL